MKVYSARSIKIANGLVAAVLVLVPFHAFMTVWGSSLVGGYTLLRLWDDVLLLVLLGIVSYWLARDRAVREWLAGSLLVRLIVLYAALSVLLGLIAWIKGDVAPKALAYGLLVNVRFLAWFLAVLLVVQQSAWLQRHWARLLVIPAAAVMVFAVLQYTVLPHNFLSHFGYNAQTTIAPIETINHNPLYIRVQSTLRGANPLGAYLVVVLSALGVLYAHARRRVLCTVLGLIGIVALFASGSRSAWIATVLSLGLIFWLRLRTQRGRLLFGMAMLAAVVVAVGGFMAVRHSPAVQNAVLHTEHGSLISVDSNEAHAGALSTGVRDVVRQPFGDGPGTAGPASQYNGTHLPRIAENYYVQVAQETGWLGLALFVSIVVLVGVELFRRAAHSLLALGIFASLIGITVVTMLSHAWTDDTLAFLWWGYAAIAVARPRASLVPAKSPKNEHD